MRGRKFVLSKVKDDELINDKDKGANLAGRDLSGRGFYERASYGRGLSGRGFYERVF